MMHLYICISNNFSLIHYDHQKLQKGDFNPTLTLFFFFVTSMIIVSMCFINIHKKNKKILGYILYSNSIKPFLLWKMVSFLCKWDFIKRVHYMGWDPKFKFLSWHKERKRASLLFTHQPLNGQTKPAEIQKQY